MKASKRESYPSLSLSPKLRAGLAGLSSSRETDSAERAAAVPGDDVGSESVGVCGESVGAGGEASAWSG